jgi:hypothetical protein
MEATMHFDAADISLRPDVEFGFDANLTDLGGLNMK